MWLEKTLGLFVKTTVLAFFSPWCIVAMGYSRYLLEEVSVQEGPFECSIIQYGGTNAVFLDFIEWNFCLMSFRSHFQVWFNVWCSPTWLLMYLLNGFIGVWKRNTKPSLLTFSDAFQIPPNSVKPSERQKGPTVNIHLHYFGKEFLR